MGPHARHRFRRRIALLAPLLTGVGACGDPPSPEVGSAQTVASWTHGQAWTVGLEPTLSIGVVSGDDAYQFDDVSAASRTPTGDLFVVDERAARVRVYGPDGTYRRELGGPGEGPGEFRRPTQIVAQSDGTVDVWDAAAWRRTRFDPDGTLADVRTTGLRELATLIEPPLYPASAHLLSDGALIVETVFKGDDAGKSQSLAEPGDVLRERRHVVLVDAERSTSAGRGELLGEEQFVVQAPWGSQPMQTVLAPRIRIASQPGRPLHCLGDQSEPLIHCYGEDGGVQTISWSSPSRSFDPQSVPLEAWRQDTHRLYGGKLASEAVDDLLDQVPLPDSWPPWTEVHLDREGHVWVGLGPYEDGTEYWIFDASGGFLGPVVMPRMKILEIGEDYVLGVHRDDVDVQHVQLLALIKP